MEIPYREPLTTAPPTRKLLLFFSDKPPRPARYEVLDIRSFVRGVEAKDPAFVGHSVNGGEICYTEKFLRNVRDGGKKDKAKPLF